LLIAEAHNPEGRWRFRLLLIADTHIQQANRPIPADFALDSLRFMRLKDEQHVVDVRQSG
jgi:hypothetical protein